MPRCTTAFANLFLHSPVLIFLGTGISLGGYCLRCLIHIRVSLLNPLNPGLGLMTDDVPNCVCYTDYFLVLYVLVLYVLVYHPVFFIVIVC